MEVPKCDLLEFGPGDTQTVRNILVTVLRVTRFGGNGKGVCQILSTVKMGYKGKFRIECNRCGNCFKGKMEQSKTALKG